MRIILATDGSIEADVAEAVCIKLPLPSTAVVTVAMVTYLQAPVGVAGMPEGMGVVDGWIAQNLRVQRAVSEQTVARIVERLGEAGIHAEGVVRQGNPCEQIEELAAEQQADLVVVGSGIDSNLAALLLGSISRRLVLHSPISVLVGKHYGEVPAEGSHDRLTRTQHLSALIAVDGSPGADVALKSLEAVRRPVFSTLYTLCVDPMPWWPGWILPAEGESGTRKVAEQAAARLEGCAERVVPIHGAGRPSIVITKEAKERKVDLVMMGATRHHPVERLLAGSCAYETATSAPCSVMVLRNQLPFE